MITIDEIENDKDVLIGTIRDVDDSTSENSTSQDESPKNDEVIEDSNDVSKDDGNESKEEKDIQSLVDKKGVKSFNKTQQEKLGHSFSKLKAKHKAEVDGLKKEIEDLKKQLENKVVKSDFENEEEYLDAKLEEKLAKKELAKKEQELDNKQSNGVMEFYTERARILYPTKQEQDAYTKAYQKGVNEGTIELVMGDSIIKEFIHESEFGPKLIEHFCMRPEVAERLSNMGTARKSVELVALESRLKNYLEKLASKEAQPKVETQNSSKEKLKVKAPVIGKVANKGVNKTNEDRFNSDEDLWEFMRSC